MRGSAKPKILILTGDLGDGHKQAARAIQEAARLTARDADVTIVDFMEWTHPHLHTLGRFCYTQWVTKFPSMYGYLFRKTREDNQLSFWFKKVKFYTLSRMARLLEEIRPTVVVSTFPPAAAAISLLKMNGLASVPTITVITDHTDHSYWIHPMTDRYLVGSEHVRTALLRQRIPDSAIMVTGIPIRPQFTGTFDRMALREKYGFDTTLPTILVMGGGLGMIGKEFISMLRTDDIMETKQFLIVCGQNEKLRQTLSEELKHSKHCIHISGYIQDIQHYMALSDLIVTKPGGLTTSEAVAMELPMLLYNPLPGQEQDNADFLAEAKVAVLAQDEEDLRARLAELPHQPHLLAEMRHMARLHQHKMAAFHAVNAILETKETYTVRKKIRRTVYAEA